MKRYSDRFQQGHLAEVNVTPLLDLAFVLLLIFMVCTPLLARQDALGVDTPSAAVSGEAEEGAVRLVLRADGSMSLKDELVPPGSLAEKLRALADGDADVALVVEADRTLSIQRLADVLSAARAAGIRRTGLATQSD